MMNQLKFDTGFFMAPNEIFDDIDTKTHEKLVYLYLCRCANNSDAFPSYKTIGEKCSMSKRKAIDCVDWLFNHGLIIKVTRRTEGFNESNIYEILRPSAQRAPRVVNDMQQGGAQDALGVVQGMHYPDAHGAPYKELPINNYSYKEKGSHESPVALQDSSSSEPVQSSESNKKKKEPKYSEDNVYYQMAVHFRTNVDEMCKREGIKNGTAKANMEKWADQFRLLVEDDEQTDLDLIKSVMDWVINDDFWSVNVRSAATFRKKYVQLVLVMKQKKKPRSGAGTGNRPNKPNIQIVSASQPEGSEQDVSEAEFEEMMRFAQQTQASKAAGGN
ncbi:hypothetical protein B2I21_07360 [Chryseobacterium mucoviscidosis]|nr:hypothetical protein B2I21_07360 [Chryseobacterium mucoviscidosis]